MIKILIKDNEKINFFMKRFKNILNKCNLNFLIKKKLYYKKPSLIKKEKKLNSIKKIQKITKFLKMKKLY